jgi:hypothetical protein
MRPKFISSYSFSESSGPIAFLSHAITPTKINKQEIVAFNVLHRFLVRLQVIAQTLALLSRKTGPRLLRMSSFLTAVIFNT